MWRKLASKVADRKDHVQVNASERNRGRNKFSQVLEERKQQQVGTNRKKTNLLSELKICSNTRNIRKGKQLHAEAIASGNDSSIYVATALVNMYAKCGSMVDARQVFDGIKLPDAVSWNAIMSGYAENREGDTALSLFSNMKSKGFAPTPITCIAAVKACTALAVKQGGTGRTECLERGKQMHLDIGCHVDTYVQNALIDMYVKCRSMVDARQVFDSMKQPDVVSWTGLILGYAENGEGVTALELFARMKSQGCTPNSVTYVAALKACTFLAVQQDGIRMAECREQGKQIHSEICGHLNIYVQNALIDMYAKCESMIDAYRVFDGIKHPDVVSWTAIILGCAENGDGVTALDIFARMRSQGCVPDSLTFVAVLKACGLLGALESGRKIHAELDAGTQLDMILVTCLVDFYARCGSVGEAQKVFDAHPRTRDIITWNALLAGYSRLGDNMAVFTLFEGMLDTGLQPNGVTFLCVLTCCSHAGLVGKANELFEAMSTNYGITPTIEHYTCVVDSLGRSNKLDNALAFMQSIPCKPNAVTWMTILSACRKWKNVEIGRMAFDALLSLDDTNYAAAYVLMAQIYGSNDLWEEQEMVLGMRKKFKVWKEPGRSCWTNDRSIVHTFLVGDSKHPLIQDFRKRLKSMGVHDHAADLLLETEKEESVCGHTVRLAIACAIIHTKPGTTIRIVKNLRICDDCHTATSLVSKLEPRSIICRDAGKFHVFKDGKCSCGNIW